MVATGVASPLAILAIAVARATHAPRLTYLACVGSLDPELPRAVPARPRTSATSTAARRRSPSRTCSTTRGAAAWTPSSSAPPRWTPRGRTNMTASGSLEQPRSKFPGVAGAATLRQWVQPAGAGGAPPVPPQPGAPGAGGHHPAIRAARCGSSPTSASSSSGARARGCCARHPWAASRRHRASAPASRFAGGGAAARHAPARTRARWRPSAPSIPAASATSSSGPERSPPFQPRSHRTV